jgi:hypothetical protein
MPLASTLPLTLTLSGSVVVTMPSSLCQRSLRHSCHEKSDESGRKLQWSLLLNGKTVCLLRCREEREDNLAMQVGRSARLDLTVPHQCRRVPLALNVTAVHEMRERSCGFAPTPLG